MTAELDILNAYNLSLHKDLQPGKLVKVKHFIEGYLVPISGSRALPSGFEAKLVRQLKDNIWECEVANNGLCEIHPCYFEENHIKVFEFFLQIRTDAEAELEQLKKDEQAAKPAKKKK